MCTVGAQVHGLGANELYMHPLATLLAKIHSDVRLTSLKIATITDFHLPDMNA